jgi:hypothetical protein
MTTQRQRGREGAMQNRARAGQAEANPDMERETEDVLAGGVKCDGRYSSQTMRIEKLDSGRPFPKGFPQPA